MKKVNREEILDDLIEVKLTDEASFSRICEVLTRIGIPNNKTKKLYQTAHLLHKKNKYYIVHFKQMFALDGATCYITDEDIVRVARIADLLQQWNLLTVEKSPYDPDISNQAIFVLPRYKLSEWELVPKYQIGVKHF